MPKMKNGITLITMTGDRPMCFKLCEQWMTKQTKAYDQWIVIDDGKYPTVPTLGQEIYRLKPDAKNTICRNLKEALQYIKYNKIIIIEDDDYYSENHIANYSKGFKKGSLIGQGLSYYYNVKSNWERKNVNDKHASLCQTGFKSSVIKTVSKACDLGNTFVDINLWKMFTGKKHIWFSDIYSCVGIKGMPGRAGTASGHEVRKTNDPDLKVFKELLGNDHKIYIPFMNLRPDDVPRAMEGIRIRRNMNGNYWIPRPNKKVEKHLDSLFERLKGSLEWRPFARGFACKNNLEELKDKYVGFGFLVGKGPSLDGTKKRVFEKHPEAPIICLNESIHKIESLGLPNPIFCLQQDAALKETCWSKKGSMLLSYITQSWYSKHPSVYGYSPKDFKLDMAKHPISAIMGLQIMNLMGVNEVKLVAFDSIISKDVSYADCVGYTSEHGGDPNRFLKFARWILQAMDSLKMRNVED